MRKSAVLGAPFDFRTGLPKELVLAKPVEQGYDPAMLDGCPGGFPLMAVRKWNGWRLIATFVPGRRVGDDQTIRLYRDGVNDDGVRHRADLHLPHVLSDFRKLNVPDWTVLSTEVIAMRGGTERLGAVGSILAMKDPFAAVARQDAEGKLKLVLHGALCWNQEWLSGVPYDQVLARLTGLAPPNRSGGYVRAVAIEPGTVAEAQQRVRDNGWEGLVITAHGYGFTWRTDKMNAENPRPDGSYKWKPQLDGDFIADEPRMSTSRKGRLKDVQLLQIAPDGRTFKCGHLGNFTAEVDAELQRRGFPSVMEVRYDGRTPAGKLVSPRFVRIRDDKAAGQCVSGESYDEADYVKK